MTIEAADKEVDELQYIISPKETEYYKKLKRVEDKRNFIYNFWKSRNNTSANKLRISFLKRIEDANNLFNEPFREGWKTDRGRMYVVYGPPDGMDKFPFEADQHASEVWQWEKIEGGAEADFVEKESNTGIYTLVNATMKNELKFPDWRTFYKVARSDSSTLKPIK